MLSFLPNVPTIILFLGIIVAGFLAFYGIFDNKLKERNKERDNLEDRVRALYKEESAAQAEKIGELTSKVESLEKKLQIISNENEIMKRLIQGRDKNTQEFQKQGFEAIKKSEIILAEVYKNGKDMKEISANIIRLAEAIEKHLSVTEKTTTIKTETQEVKVKTPKQ